MWPGWLIPLATVVACGGTDERTLRLVRVEPPADPACGAAVDGITMLVTARGDFPPSEAIAPAVDLQGDDAIRIDSFPAATRVLELEVLGAGGVTRRVGRTAPFDVEALADGAELPVFMAPERGFCPTGSAPGIPRDRPLAARAGAGVLVAGGLDDSVDPPVPVDAVELYDPATGRLSTLTDTLYGNAELGLTGASMTTADDGRVLVAGGAEPAYQVFDPATGELEPAGFLGAVRAHHAAVALAGGRVLLAGGCGQVDAAGLCVAGTALATTSIVDLVDREVRDGPPLQLARIGAAALAEPDGRVLLVGGVDEAGLAVTTGERIDPASVQPAETIDGLGGLGVRLISGASLVALAGTGAPAADGVAIVPPGGAAAIASLAAPAPRAGASLTAIDTGRVLVFGGLSGAGDQGLLWDPDGGRFEAADAELVPPARSDHAAVLLDDGSVLLIGGRDGDGARADAWIFRPELIGAFTSDVTLGFGGSDALAIVPSNPARVRRETGPPRLVISAGGSGGALPADWIVVGGPRFTGLQLTARIEADAGAAVLLGFVHERDHAAVVLVPGQRARLYRRLGGDALIVDGCDGEVIGAEDLSPAGAGAELVIDVRADSIAASLDGRSILACRSIEPIGRGAIGLGPVGAAGSELSVSLLTVTR